MYDTPMRASLMRPLCALALAAAGCAGGPPAQAPKEIRSPRRGFIHPLLDTEQVEFTELRPFQHKLERARERLLSEGRVSALSLYFRDLDNGPAFGIEGDAPFRPASLLKLPVMMAYLKKHENDPGILSQRLSLDPMKEPPVQAYPPYSPLQPGREYTVDELLRAMIAHSDNNAVNTLLGAMSEEDFFRVYEDLGLRIPNVRDIDDPIGVREYARFLRILYNASYLTKDLSQRALEYLAATAFDAGLKAGLPPAVPVAHKFGESWRGGGSERQLHDCGIVYHRRTPYILCVMTRGTDMRAMAAAIAEVSALVYREVDGPR